MKRNTNACESFWSNRTWGLLIVAEVLRIVWCFSFFQLKNRYCVVFPTPKDVIVPLTCHFKFLDHIKILWFWLGWHASLIRNIRTWLFFRTFYVLSSYITWRFFGLASRTAFLLFLLWQEAEMRFWPEAESCRVLLGGEGGRGLVAIGSKKLNMLWTPQCKRCFLYNLIYAILAIY